MIVTDHRSKFCDDGLERRQIGLELDQHVGQHPELGAGVQGSDQCPRLSIRSIQDAQQLKSAAGTDRRQTIPQPFVDRTPCPVFHDDGVSVRAVQKTS